MQHNHLQTQAELPQARPRSCSHWVGGRGGYLLRSIVAAIADWCRQCEEIGGSSVTWVFSCFAGIYDDIFINLRKMRGSYSNRNSLFQADSDVKKPWKSVSFPSSRQGDLWGQLFFRCIFALQVLCDIFIIFIWKLFFNVCYKALIFLFLTFWKCEMLQPQWVEKITHVWVPILQGEHTVTLCYEHCGK